MSDVTSLYDYRIRAGKPIAQVVFLVDQITRETYFLARIPARFGFVRHAERFEGDDGAAAHAWAETAWRKITRFDVDALHAVRCAQTGCWQVFRRDMMALGVPLASFAEEVGAYAFIGEIAGVDLFELIGKAVDAGRRIHG